MIPVSADAPQKVNLDVMNWLYGGDMDVDVSHKSYKVVKTRYPHLCAGPYHDKERCSRMFPTGTRMVRETALVDGKWCSCYTCFGCMAEAKRELGPR